MTWIQTFTGEQFFPFDPKAEDICIEDIAHHLAMKCRFGGAVRQFYSVAEHSVRLAHELPARIALEGLLHDAAEAYLPDIPSPIKAVFCVDMSAIDGRRQDRIVNFSAFEDSIMRVAGEKFGLRLPLPPEVREADLRMLATEKRDLMEIEPAPWAGLPEPFEGIIKPWPPDVAEAWFMKTFNFLTKRGEFSVPPWVKAEAPAIASAPGVCPLGQRPVDRLMVEA